MKSMRFPLLIALSVAIIGIILGSFFDLAISSAIASADNGFGLTISAIGPTIGFCAVSLMGGGLIALAVKGDYHIVLKILFYILAACCFGVTIYYAGGEYFGVNGFYKAAPKIVGYIIVFFPATGALVGGYFLFKDCQNKNMWIIFVTVIGLLLIALLFVIPTIKDNMHRPRYRLISKPDVDIAFHNWWQPCKNYKDLIAQYNTSGDNFKSYPSGHTAEASILFVAVTFYPLANKKFAKYQLPVFICSGVIVLLVAFARILAAAHFLSDVSFGATIMLVLTFVANEVVMRIKPLQLQEEE